MMQLHLGARAKSDLLHSIDNFISARLTGWEKITQADEDLVRLLIGFWKKTTDVDLRSAALAIAECPDIPSAIRETCIENLCIMPTQSFADHVILMLKNESNSACIRLVEDLMSRRINAEMRACWRDLLQWTD